MIRNLHIENYALIEHLDIDMHAGFSVITGETGAGKSIILGAIALLLGQRADTKAIKTGAKRCVIEATFDVAGYGLDAFFCDNDFEFDGNELIVRREITSAGKSRAFINDTPASLSLLKEIGEQLIDVHSQHKNLLLGREDFQLSVLDILAHQQDTLYIYKKEYNNYKAVCRQLQETIDEAKRSRDDEEFLRFQLDQLKDADLTDGEQEELENESEMLNHAEDIKHGLYEACGCLQNPSDGTDALQLVKQSLSALRGISRHFQDADEIAERLNSCYIEMKDIADEIESQSDEIEYNPQRLQWVDERLSTIYSLQKKHHVDSVAELLQIQSELSDRLQKIDGGDELIAELTRKRDAQLKVVMAKAAELSKARHEAARQVEHEMTERLVPLGMPNVRFQVKVEERKAKGETVLSETGCDEVSFLFSANKNGTLNDVASVASGGEIARVMLSLKALIAGAVKLPTIIFDEIDTGVSGGIAEKMAKIMREMGDQNRQVISITHLPQIAALGSSHYKVYKEDNDESTVSHIVELDHEQRVIELAHMLSGESLTDAAVDNARALLNA